jgi:peptidoglycan/xylan/chitin deacetylase (PgdA/CDA1 family)
MPLRSLVLVSAYAVLRRSPLQTWFRWRSAPKLAVLAYHRVPDREAFAAQLAYLKRKAHPVSLDELLAAARRGGSLPPRSVLLTFDDADRSHLETALPLLREHGVPAVVFVVTGVLDSDEPFWFDEVSSLLAAGVTVPELRGLKPVTAVERLTRLPDPERRATLDRLRAAASRQERAISSLVRRPQLRSHELPLFESAGIAVGNHTLGHACLDRCDEATAREEIFAAHERLTHILGHEPRAFAYPGGFLDARAVALVAEAGYELAFAYDDRLSAWPPSRPLAVSRLRGNACDSVDRLALTLSGLHAAGWRAQTGLQAAGRRISKGLLPRSPA